MTTEVVLAFQEFRSKFHARLLATALSPTGRDRALQAFELAYEAMTNPKSPQPDNETLWEE